MPSVIAVWYVSLFLVTRILRPILMIRNMRSIQNISISCGSGEPVPLTPDLFRVVLRSFEDWVVRGVALTHIYIMRISSISNVTQSYSNKYENEISSTGVQHLSETAEWTKIIFGQFYPYARITSTNKILTTTPVSVGFRFYITGYK